MSPVDQKIDLFGSGAGSECTVGLILTAGGVLGLVLQACMHYYDTVLVYKLHALLQCVPPVSHWCR
jgi:hypothetical protein